MKYKGLLISKDVLDKVTLPNSQLGLLASGDGIEIMMQSFNENITFDIFPVEDNPSLMEFFYVLEGCIEYYPNNSNDRILINKGEFFYTKFLDELCIFKTLSKVKLLYVSSQPVFHYIGESLKELHKINEEINEKDNYTRRHSERVQRLAFKIGLEMNLNREVLTRLSIAALFHDLGKIYIDNKILNKPSKLTNDEFELMKKHPINSAEYVKNKTYIDVSDIVLQHHERIDGSGYPKGLKNEDICIEAKIIAVADSYDAMTSDRPYRKGMEREKAINEIKKLSGILYDEDVVKAFIKVMS